MKKLNIITLSALGCAAILISATSFATGTQVAPFNDNMQVNISNFPAGGASVAYTNDDTNRVNITGDSSTINPGNSNYMVHISSNYWSNGFPSMILTLPSTGQVCKFTYIDGALVNALDYADHTPPQCSHLTISPITKDGQYTYHMNISYNDTKTKQA
ncbi:MAG: hypothetical protein COB66_02690 [Coxiella sp. (in: Bacteria)]|nr:MAG: hypothetical protein COB66_02690 [Coxiella sp. (in: g-proteobacteria)]